MRLSPFGKTLFAVTLSALGVLLGAPELRADTIAFWSFDEPVAGGAKRASGESVAGKFGRAFRPGLRAAAFATGLANPTDSRLNLGAHDWTIECWLHLDPIASDEGVIFEIGSGPRGADDFVTRFSVLPRENAFALSCLVSAATGLARRVEFANPEGPPSGVAWRHVATLALGDDVKLTRAGWFHVALVHDGLKRELRLFLDGRPLALAVLAFRALPRGDQAYLSIGRAGDGRRVLAGAIDELRVCDHAVYDQIFTLPAGRAVESHDRAVRAGPAGK